MAKFVPDQSTRRWVVIAPSRVERPENLVKQKSTCPFCEGNENETPPEVWRVGGEGNWNKPGWKVRVVPNKFKITDIHEVIIHSPDGFRDIEELELEQVGLILKVYRQRYQNYQNQGHVLIFCNHGKHSGASLSHPHSQLVVIPRQITLDALSPEALNNIVDENTFFNVYCPDFSQWPYEVWIAPKEKRDEAGKEKEISFGEISDEEIIDLAKILQLSLQKLAKISQSPVVAKINVDTDFTYNYYIHQSKTWYLRIIPRFIHRAGFELGTGLSVNIVDPSVAAEELRQIF
ncbi:DUF4931 domain-containing protein [Candidatus Gottesmanbacteria bacterium]|nr:DUF4931 domain-containing protein [Candidatus Gottesmanbacteria bacterium]